MLIFWKYFDKGNSVLICFFFSLTLFNVTVGKYETMHVVPGTNLFIVIKKKKWFVFFFFRPQQCGILVPRARTEHMPSAES